MCNIIIIVTIHLLCIIVIIIIITTNIIFQVFAFEDLCPFLYCSPCSYVASNNVLTP